MEFIVAEFSTGNAPSLQVGNVNPSASSSNLLKEFQSKFLAHTGANVQEAEIDKLHININN